MAQKTQQLLQSINNPDDLKKLDINQLPELCQELRTFIIDELSQNPGHLGASLGVVELSVALHYVFNTPYDRIIWDVGHQAYAHKILTGRRDRFHTNRQLGGISGFPSPKESEYDSFGVGHSSTSISAGLGMSIAAHLNNEDRQVVAVIGDGAMTGGLAFEGINNASINPNNLLIILNDNHMAIDPIEGGLSNFLGRIHISPTYNRLRFRLYKLLRRMHIITDSSRGKIIRFTNSLKSLRANTGNNIFEGLSIRYFGPVDGHNIELLIDTLHQVKQFNGAKVVHIITKKGKGYKPAEKLATVWHAPGEFDPKTGERIFRYDGQKPPLFQDVFGHTLLELAQSNEKIMGITPAMPSGCSMCIMMKEMPERVFDVGIAEGHAVTFSAGLAKEGLLPFCNIYSSFMQRAYDNVIHDVALQNLNVVLCVDRAGVVGSDGATHQGLFDLAYFRCIPNLTIASPFNEIDLRNLMYTAQLPDKGAFVIRYPRGRGVLLDWKKPFEELPIGKGQLLSDGTDAALLSIGPIGNIAQKALATLATKGISVAHYDMRFLKPIDEEILYHVGKNFAKIITLEDGVISGGFGSAVLEFMADKGYKPSVMRLGIDDQFVEHGTQAELYHLLGLDEEGIASSIEKFINSDIL
ncbi:MAG TPA: 1-deoxy-D-xylulose-5-phosphate synthase [Paludibacteraceae bacterium]|jgi:1-deoxy-D-xylulose-5-phosphate synthase|nr:1-deoxy-D-xylulose-5-phosphate synthase [Paludibacteraceae bacterium]HOH71079.1 1-deoxy-D-xylulose-5-phosphate synthase [Paludibacteraceae bacterium]HPW96022.1 1-deoxy-D-xylulose-5-phosphate synthase [Paludibacteraceae bacterium]HQC04681.1 1-deoxy-D-xylulose-5-phosphate synthase [Paludibacteraceae bacterium]HRU72319.1 1-deoxy-D-xylulose-5-phosphate synthase [Paludibacteraceae bacterium]